MCSRCGFHASRRTASSMRPRSSAPAATHRAADASSLIIKASARASSTGRCRQSEAAPRARAAEVASNEVLAQASAEQVDGDHRDDHDDDLCRRLGILKAANALVERLADAAGTNDPESRGRAHVGFQPVERERTPQRHDLRYDAEDDLLQAACPGCADALDRSRIYGLDRFGEQLGEHAEIVNENGHN